MMQNVRPFITLLLILAALFSGQTLAGGPGHKFFYVQNADALLRHNADSEELRRASLEAAADFRDRYRKPLRGTPRLFIHDASEHFFN